MAEAVERKTTTLDRQWIGLEEASQILGISATTLRRWSDAGIIETFVTPGGHRRLNREAVKGLLPSHVTVPSLERLGETPEHIARVYRRAAARGRLPWVDGLDEAQRSAFREHGRFIAAEILAALDAPDDAERNPHLQAASEAAAEYGVAAALGGVSVTRTVEAFLRFRRPFIDELWAVVSRRALDVAAAAALIRAAGDAFDRLLVATVRAHEEASADSPSAER